MSSITTIQSTDVIANSRADINTNFSNLNTDKIETSTLDTDTALTANSDSKIATQKAVKAYVDSGGQANASETVRGLVEEATDAEVTAGTSTGGTGAKLFVSAAKLKTVTDLKASTSSLPANKIYISTTEVTFTAGNGGNGAGVEKSVFSTTIPAGTLGTNNGIKFKCFISGADASSSASAWIIKISLGTTILTLTDGGGGSNPLTGMSGFLEGYILADGATNAQKVSATLFLSANKNEDQGDTSVVVTKLYIGGTATAAKDSTGALTFEILATLANNAGNNGVFEWLVVEKLN